ncbi:hypothetical protein E2C01_090639 [Portunus trituberculatus]|uniref:Uncharacterized protein n=1 Tax=Portunus trituberculatus TaxID=210409 RepID=A0A5B7JMA5_PORTR|nr:hypothetical protein [Portunus trituberculatus]
MDNTEEEQREADRQGLSQRSTTFRRSSIRQSLRQASPPDTPPLFHFVPRQTFLPPDSASCRPHSHNIPPSGPPILALKRINVNVI